MEKENLIPNVIIDGNNWWDIFPKIPVPLSPVENLSRNHLFNLIEMLDAANLKYILSEGEFVFLKEKLLVKAVRIDLGNNNSVVFTFTYNGTLLMINYHVS